MLVTHISKLRKNIKFKTPMITVLIVHPNRDDATCYYRALAPLVHMQKKGLIKFIDGTIDGFQISWATIIQCDVVFLQRPCGKDHLIIMELARKMNKPVWACYDDNYLNIPPSNPRYESYMVEGRQYLIEDCIKMADMVTVSTEEIKTEYLKHNPNVVVVPNAYDETMFELPSKHNKSKIVLLRAGDTHKENLLHYKDDIIKCFYEHPQYTWVFMGMSTPEWLTGDLDAPNERIKLYDFQDIFTYFHYLMEINPEIVICPLEDIAFNRSRSNNNWIEGTLAGAIVVATALPEFQREGVIEAPIGDFKAGFDFAVNCNQDAFFELSKQNIPSLEKVNPIRFKLLNDLMEKFEGKRIKPVKTITPEVYNDEYFFKHYLKHGWTQENESHRLANAKAVDWMIETFDPQRVLELGSGPGLMLERFHAEQVYALGVEMNQYFLDYFKQRNPLTAHLAIKGDITEPMEFPHDFDLVISVEVFEHIDQPEEKWDEMLKKLAENAKWFVFSSTQYHTSAKFDIEWGHCNIRRSEKWKELFERNGWEYHGPADKIAPWGMCFKSKIFTPQVEMEIR